MFFDLLPSASQVQIYIYTRILTLRIRNQGPPKQKRDHPHLPHSPPSEVEGVRIVVISFQNIAKKRT